MKIGESVFDILYLLTAVALGLLLLIRGKKKASKLMGWAALILGAGDAFHLVPRVLDHFSDSDFTAALGIGKLVTSLTMTVFYLFMLAICRKVYGKGLSHAVTVSVLVLTAARFVLCLLPQNGWLENAGSVSWGVIRNVPFVLLGILVVILYFRERKKDPFLRRTWLWVTLSFLFYLPVATAAPIVPMLGMLMLPKTLCYVAILISFCRYSFSEK